MPVVRHPVFLAWQGPLPDRHALPTGALHDVRLRLDHGADGHSSYSVRAALEPLAGEPRVRRVPLLGPRLRWSSERWPLDVRVRRASVEVRVGHRLKANALAQLVEALATIPGARNLRLSATEPECEPRPRGTGAASCH